MSFALAAAGAALIGAGLVAWAFPHKSSCPAEHWLRAAIAATLGLGIWSATYAASLLLFGPAARGPKDAVLAAAGAALLLAARGKSGVEPAAPPGEKKIIFFSGEPAPRWLWVAFAVAAGAAVLAFVHDTLRGSDGGYDAFMIWNLRARFLARAGAGFRAAFSPQMELWAHQDYPWLVPGLVAQGFLLSGREPRAVPALFAGTFAALAVALPALSLGWARGSRWGLLGAIALLTTPCFVIFAAHQESDVPLAAFLAATAALLLFAAERGNPPRLLLLAGLAAGLGAWTKNEGSLYAACFAMALLARSRELRAVGWFGAGFLPAAALVVGFKLGFAPPTDLWKFSTAGSILSHAGDPLRWGRLLLLTLRRIFFFQDHALWVAAEIALLIAWVRKLPGSVPGTALFLACAAFAPLYVLQPHPLEWLYRYSVERIFIQLWPAAILATLLPLVRVAADTPREASSGSWPMERAPRSP
jgi:hypothetical protein